MPSSPHQVKLAKYPRLRNASAGFPDATAKNLKREREEEDLSDDYSHFRPRHSTWADRSDAVAIAILALGALPVLYQLTKPVGKVRKVLSFVD
ncbi:hypothetical protein NDU88_000915 [Pleurodeles waltl]|uniref:Uncharacterized protein n=1 Tax=Pleurodeles waltl TaxID=8319 RepID=A0AAV7L7Z2_PLEWA|nr:hypothetical protein NDU88_000915 [Pleurodeles waltl]